MASRNTTTAPVVGLWAKTQSTRAVSQLQHQQPQAEPYCQEMGLSASFIITSSLVQHLSARHATLVIRVLQDQPIQPSESDRAALLEHAALMHAYHPSVAMKILVALRGSGVDAEY